MAGSLLGAAQHRRIVARYRQMRQGYDCTYDEWQSLFTPQLHPFDNYPDTTAVTMPVRHEPFSQDFAGIGQGAIGLDLPTWFNIRPGNRRVMLVFQDPLRDADSYGACCDAVLSSPFGLHDKTHREHPHGGKMAEELVKRLVAAGYGVYLTDARKYFVHDRKTTRAYSRTRMPLYADILKREIDLVQPAVCLAIGRVAERALAAVVTDVPRGELPHLSGTARGAMVKRYPQLKEIGATAGHIAQVYTGEIIAYMEQAENPTKQSK